MLPHIPIWVSCLNCTMLINKTAAYYRISLLALISIHPWNMCGPRLTLSTKIYAMTNKKGKLQSLPDLHGEKHLLPQSHTQTCTDNNYTKCNTSFAVKHWHPPNSVQNHENHNAQVTTASRCVHQLHQAWKSPRVKMGLSTGPGWVIKDTRRYQNF